MEDASHAILNRSDSIQAIQEKQGIVGRAWELSIALSVVASGRHLLLEGPVGVGKTTVALAVCNHGNRKTVRVDGDDRYTESKLTGWFDPPLVLKQGYNERAFLSGPLLEAMRDGSVLFINELNRMPEAVQNVLLPALDEKLLILPRIGQVIARPGFQVIATQNPVEYVATGHLSEALKDRFEHVAIEYQTEEEERAIVVASTGCQDARLVERAVALTRRTRSDQRFRKGASIRAAIAMVEIGRFLEGADLLRTAAKAALPTRVELKDQEDSDLSEVIDELCEAEKKKT